MSECLPPNCDAKCCRYVAIVLDTPRSKSDFENIRWFVSHENIAVHKDKDGDWLVEFVTPCKYLNDQLCSIYENRPEVCRKYDPDDCEKKFDTTEITFKNIEDVERFTAQRWDLTDRKNKRKDKKREQRREEE